jgi:hypothetical protein
MIPRDREGRVAVTNQYTQGKLTDLCSQTGKDQSSEARCNATASGNSQNFSGSNLCNLTSNL